MSIILLTRNGLKYTKQCVESILKYTPEPFELIFVDNKSTDGTVEYLKNIKNAKVICNQVNKGFAGGCNQGLLISQGEYIVLLNNDTVVTRDWLTRQLWWLKRDPAIGIVGPRSNKISIEQKIHHVPYQTMNEMQQFAQKWSKAHDRKGFQPQMISGLCMVFHRNLVDKIGGFDTRFFPGYFEDDDFSIRTMISGKKLWVANDVYIHHFGSQSFSANNENQKGTLHKNRLKFFRKWRIGKGEKWHAVAKREKPFKKERHYVPLI